MYVYIVPMTDKKLDHNLLEEGLLLQLTLDKKK